MPTAAALQSFWNDRWLPHPELHVAVDDLGFTQGVTAVERMRTYGGRAFQVCRHLQRFASTTDGLQISRLPDQQAQREIVEELLQRNERWMREQQDAGIVLFATPGPVGRPSLLPQHHSRSRTQLVVHEAASPTFVAHLSVLPFAAIARHIRVGQPLFVTDIVQPSAKSMPRHWKVRSRLHYFLADRQAAAVDADAVGVLLDEDGSVTETSVANLAVVQAGQIVSPPAERVLPGVTQAVAEQIAAELKIIWRKRPLAVEELHQADEVLLFGTTTGIWPARPLTNPAAHQHRSDSAALPKTDTPAATAGPVFRMMRNRFDAICAAGSAH